MVAKKIKKNNGNMGGAAADGRKTWGVADKVSNSVVLIRLLDSSYGNAGGTPDKYKIAEIFDKSEAMTRLADLYSDAKAIEQALDDLDG